MSQDGALRPPAEDAPPAPPECKLAFSEPPKGKPLAQALSISQLSLAVPANIYGSACICGVLFEIDTFGSWMATCGQSYLRLALNHALQSFLLIALRQLDNWQEDTITIGTDCYHLTWWFFAICHWLFFSVVLTEIQETLDLIELILLHIPTVEGASTCLRFEADAEGNTLCVGGGMNKARKACITSFVLVPKLAFGLATLSLGGSFLSTSGSNTDLLLNSLAACFILDVDEQIYALLAPAYVRRVVESVPPWEVDEVGATRQCFRIVQQQLVLIFSSLLVVLFWITAPRCLNDPCEGAILPCPVI